MRYFLHLCYKGTHYHGWQRQENARTVQGCIEAALSTLLRTPTEVTGCGRTDTGVHARSYYAHFDTDQVQGTSFLHALNAILPEDISIYSIHEAAATAHARFSAVSRSYRYFIHTRKEPFLSDRSYYFRQAVQPDLAEMNQFCKALLELEDFSSFEKKGSDNAHSLCQLMHAEWHATPEGMVFEIQANRFLRNMVRAITGASLMVGCGKAGREELLTQVAQKHTLHLTMTAPAHGLHLWSIDYPENTFSSL